jgi:phage tail-like protein
VRGVVPELLSAHPIGQTLPGIYRADDFTQRFCAGLDDVLAPIIATLDSLPAYLDPATAPDDMLVWLSSWMGIVIDRHQSAERQRQLVRDGAELLRWRGTTRGVRSAVRSLFGAEPEITEPGGVIWSARAGLRPPTSGPGELVVRLGLPKPTQMDVRRLDELIVLVKPAHVRHRLDVFATEA